MEHDNSMSERILRSLENIVINDTELREFCLIPAELNHRNVNPVVYEDHYVGLESWCKKYVLQYCCSELFNSRIPLRKGKLSITKMDNLNYLLIGALLLKPQDPTFWNMKRELIKCDILSIERELVFCKLVLTYSSKCSEVFSYRRWLIERLMNKTNFQSPIDLLQQELLISEMTVSKAENNYHAWNYRIWCLENLGKKCPEYSGLIFKELDFSQRWISMHISEHAGYHYRKYLIQMLYESRFIFPLNQFYYDKAIEILQINVEGDVHQLLIFLLGNQPMKDSFLEDSIKYINLLSVLIYELFYKVEDLNSFYPGHESLWSYRKFLVYYLLKICYQYHSLDFKGNIRVSSDKSKSLDVNIADQDLINLNAYCESGEKLPKIFKSQPNKVESSYIYKLLVKREEQFIRQNSNSEYYFVKRYENWSNFILCHKEDI